MTQSSNVDLVVIGGGIAGLSAAVRAAESGLNVALLERGTGEHYQCNSRWSGGVLHVAFKNIKDRPEALFDAIQSATDGQADPALARALAETSGRAGEWISKQGAKFVRMNQIEWQQWVMAPPRRIMPGLDWQGRGPDFTLRTLLNNLVRLGGRIYLGTAAVALMEREGKCVGVEAQQGDAALQFNSSAVLLADGGFQGNLDLVRQHISAHPEKLKQRGASTGIGDGLSMAQALGGQIADLKRFYGHVLAREAFGNDKAWPYPQLDELGMAGMLVGSDGKRFADEGRGGVFLANAIAQLAEPLSAWAIFDSAIWEGPGKDARIPANPHLVSAGVRIAQANTLKELATQTGLPCDELEATVSEHGRALATGDLDRLQPARTTEWHAAWPIAKAPFYAVPVCAGITYTLGGIVIDEHARVLKSSGEAIPGLYAAGSTTAGLEGRQESSTYVGGLMKGLVFGLRCAEHAASTFGPQR
jgi:fumarate reductase flavoprotein subunit